MKIILKSKKKNYLATICIGKKYKKDWQKFTLPSWKLYCKKNDIGIVYFENELIRNNHEKWKKPVWQQLLIGSKIQNKKIKNICYIDTDVFINPWAPNIFKNYDEKKIAVVSSINHLPFDLENTKKKIVFFRKKFLNSKYPLNSSIFADLRQVYSYCNLKPQKDLICSGVYVFNKQNHSELLKKWFYLYDKNIKSITSGGIQTHFSYHVLKANKVQWLDYKFQAHWIYELANNYSFLYKTKNKELIKECLLNCLMNNYFVHCAGSWHEGRMWKNILFNNQNIFFYEKLNKFFRSSVKSKIRGFISQD